MSGGGPVQVVVIEDNAADVELILRALKSHRLANQVAVLRDGAEALERLLPSAEAGPPTLLTPRVILLDLKLPKVDGLEVLKRMRADARTRLQPVVVLTTSNEERDVIASYKLGANSYIRKPVDFEQFMDAVRQLGLFWLVLNVPPPRS